MKVLSSTAPIIKRGLAAAGLAGFVAIITAGAASAAPEDSTITFACGGVDNPVVLATSGVDTGGEDLVLTFETLPVDTVAPGATTEFQVFQDPDTYVGTFALENQSGDPLGSSLVVTTEMANSCAAEEPTPTDTPSETPAPPADNTGGTNTGAKAASTGIDVASASGYVGVVAFVALVVGLALGRRRGATS